MRARKGPYGSIDGRRNHERCLLHASGAATRLFAALTLIAGAAHGGSVLDWYGTPPTLGGNGTWNTTGLDWSSDGLIFSAWNNSAGNTAQFIGTGGTVGLATPITAGGLNFVNSGFALASGNTLTVAASGEITLAPATTANIDTPVVANTGVALQGTGTLNINGSLGGSLTLSGNGLSTSNTPVLNLVSDPTGGAALNINGGTGDGVFGGTMTGAGSLVKSGASVVELSGANTFTGSTTISGGALALGSEYALQYSTVNLNSNGGLNLNGLASATIGGLAGAGTLNLGVTALTVGGVATTTYSGVLSGTLGGLTYAGTGALTLSGGGAMDTLSMSAGEVNIAGGTLALTDIDKAVNIGAGTLSISGGATVNANATSTWVQTTGAAINVSGAGTTLNVLGGFGLVNVDSSGILAVSNGAVVNSHYIMLGQYTTGTLTISSGGAVNDSMVQIIAGAATVSGQGSIWANQILYIYGNPGDPAALNVSSGGSVTVAGVTELGVRGYGDAYSSININGGTLTTGSLVGTQGTINLTADPAGGSALTINAASGSAEFDGTITGAGGLVKSGGSSQTLGGANTFTGSTTINGGQLVLANGLALQNSAVSIDVNNGLNLNGLASATIGGLTGARGLNLGATALTVGGAATTTYSGVLSGTTGSLTYAGTGTLALSGASTIANLVVSSGALNVTGTLTLTDENAGINVTGGALTIYGGASVNNSNSYLTLANGAGATLTVTGAGTTLNAGNQWYADNGGSLAASNGAVVNSSLTIVGADASGTLLVSSGGTVNDSTGLLGSGDGGATGTATVTGTGSLWANQVLGIGGSSGAAGTGTLNINAGGSVTVAVTTILASGSSININGGSLTTGQLAGTAGMIDLQANPIGGSALVLTRGTRTAAFSGTITGAGGISQTGGNQILTGFNTYTGQTLVSGATLTQQGGSNNSQITAGNGGVFYALNTTLSPLNGFGAIATQSGGQVLYDGATVNGGFLEGTGHSIINRGATFNGTTIDGNAVVAQNAAATFNNVTNNGTINNNATLMWNGGTNGPGGVLNVNSLVNAVGLVTSGVINISDGNTVFNTGSDLTLGAGSRTYVGSLANPGGTLSETGGTIELNGGLLVNNGTVDGTLDVNYGGLAEGAGTYGAVNIGTGGVFHPGNSPGTVTSSSATFGAGGGFDFDIDNATGMEGTDWSLWDITGNLTITAGTTPNSEFTIYLDSPTSGEASGPLENFNPAHSYSWTIIDAANIDGFSAADFALSTTGFDEALDSGTFSLESNGQDLTLDFTPAAATPEPGTWFLVGSGLLALLPAMRKGIRSSSSPITRRGLR
jgi:fibronectin-binding autotransporter adhesin